MKSIPIATSLLLATAALYLSPLNLTQAKSSAPVTSPVSEAKTLTVDGGHSSVLFRIQHMKAAYFYGRFNDVSGEIVLDEADPSKCKVKITIAADSVDSNSGKRDEHIKSPDFMDVKQFPAMEFISKKVERTGGVWKVTGDLEFHGANKEITVEFEKTGEGPGRGGATVYGFHSRFEIDRTDWGMDFMVGPLGKEIELTISLETTDGK